MNLGSAYGLVSIFTDNNMPEGMPEDLPFQQQHWCILQLTIKIGVHKRVSLTGVCSLFFA